MLALSVTAARANAVMQSQLCICTDIYVLLHAQILNAELLSDVFYTPLQQRSLQTKHSLDASAIFV